MSGFPIDTVFAALAARLGERATRAAAVVAAHGASESYHAAHPPDVVVFPHTTEEVAAIVADLRRARARRSCRSAPAPRSKAMRPRVHGGVCIDFAR